MLKQQLHRVAFILIMISLWLLDEQITEIYDQILIPETYEVLDMFLTINLNDKAQMRQ